MGFLVRAVGSGIGLASEAIHDYRARSRGDGSASPNPETVSASSQASSSAQAWAPGTAAQELGLSPPYSEKPYSEKSKAAEAGYDDEHDDSSSDSEDDVGGAARAADEAAWELDDMAEQVAPPSYDESTTGARYEVTPGDSDEVKIAKEDQMVRDMVRMAGPAPQPVRRIPCPVIIPQRRPRNKDRGFVHAYAPLMQGCGIGQEVFSKFLKDWLSVSKADPWIDVVFVAAGVVGLIPEVASQVVGTVVQVIAGTAKELQSRYRRNTFLDRVNQDLFMPRGLYAMVMAFKDVVPGQQPRGPLSRLAGTLGKQLFAAERLDINQTAAKYSNPDVMSNTRRKLKDIRLTSGKTVGEVELPEAAPLVYPDLDRAAEQDLQEQGNGKGKEKEGIKQKWKGAGEWVGDYLDRRAQATYEGQQYHPSSLAVPSSARAGFSSRYSDPNHAANSGSLVSLLTGGAVNPKAHRQERRAAKRERKGMRREYKDERRMMKGREPRGPRRARAPRGQRQGIIKKIMQQDVMYLLIVNLPTEEEVQKSVADLERMVAAEGVQEMA
ncbi:Uu.00g047670.m01.CDS01 [Anthostomella pinea]|uniref:Uu.00g047670.m01.CDS01 n=1 Tax=Anthostomella pinea TaxID=933095 RepID=A0AAI8YC78_9PEZI|nr:Uu.00g047670.m01.CDS01 [Anthostomella pinea]